MMLTASVNPLSTTSSITSPSPAIYDEGSTNPGTASDKNTVQKAFNELTMANCRRLFLRPICLYELGGVEAINAANFDMRNSTITSFEIDANRLMI
jgi:hypothetical protein